MSSTSAASSAADTAAPRAASPITRINSSELHSSGSEKAKVNLLDLPPEVLHTVMGLVHDSTHGARALGMLRRTSQHLAAVYETLPLPRRWLHRVQAAATRIVRSSLKGNFFSTDHARLLGLVSPALRQSVVDKMIRAGAEQVAFLGHGLEHLNNDQHAQVVDAVKDMHEDLATTAIGAATSAHEVPWGLTRGLEHMSEQHARLIEVVEAMSPINQARVVGGLLAKGAHLIPEHLQRLNTIVANLPDGGQEFFLAARHLVPAVEHLSAANQLRLVDLLTHPQNVSVFAKHLGEVGMRLQSPELRQRLVEATLSLGSPTQRATAIEGWSGIMSELTDTQCTRLFDGAVQLDGRNGARAIKGPAGGPERLSDVQRGQLFQIIMAMNDGDKAVAIARAWPLLPHLDPSDRTQFFDAVMDLPEEHEVSKAHAIAALGPWLVHLDLSDAQQTRLVQVVTQMEEPFAATAIEGLREGLKCLGEAHHKTIVEFVTKMNSGHNKAIAMQGLPPGLVHKSSHGVLADAATKPWIHEENEQANALANLGPDLHALVASTDGAESPRHVA